MRPSSDPLSEHSFVVVPQRPPLPPDPDGMPVKDVHVRLNAWEHAQLQKLGRRECASMQRLIRMLVRERLFAVFGDPRVRK